MREGPPWFGPLPYGVYTLVATTVSSRLAFSSGAQGSQPWPGVPKVMQRISNREAFRPVVPRLT